jgi:hypothetical protein
MTEYFVVVFWHWIFDIGFLTLDVRHWIFDIGFSSVFFIPVITFSVIGLLSIKVGDKLLIWNKDKSFLRQKENKHKSNWGGRKFHEMIYLLSWTGKNKLKNFNRLFKKEYESQWKKKTYVQRLYALLQHNKSLIVEWNW